MSKTIQKVTWEQLDEMCNHVALDFYQHASGYPIINSIIAIGSGGLIPARLIAERLHNPKIYVFGVRSFDRDGKRCEPTIYQAPDMVFTGQRVLIVDDIVDSGQTLSLIRSTIIAQNPDRLHTATIHYKTTSSIKPDYFATTIDDKKVWIQYPYEIEE